MTLTRGRTVILEIEGQRFKRCECFALVAQRLSEHVNDLRVQAALFFFSQGG